jgi:hypothetical protein
MTQRHVLCWPPPWHCASHQYEFELVTTYLVVALKAAPTTSDQHKIAFSIQQLLALLNEAGREGLLLCSPKNPQQTKTLSRSEARPPHVIGLKPKMDDSLISKLVEARVLDDVEPFWFSEFHEVRQFLCMAS